LLSVADASRSQLLHFHYYSPYDFVFGAWGKTVWGTAEELAAVSNDLGVVRGNFTDVPLVLGECESISGVRLFLISGMC
jgi:endoglucanase